MTPQTLRRLTYFSVIADAGSIREASRRLGLSPVAVSESLTEFEAELGVTLATRDTRRFELTGEGRRVEQIAARMLAAADDLFVELQDPTDIEGEVGLTAPVELASSWLVPKLKKFRFDYPLVKLTVSASDHIENLQQSPFDVALRTEFVPPGDVVPHPQTHKLFCASAEPFEIEQHGQSWFVDRTLIHTKPDREIAARHEATGQITTLTFRDVIVVDNKLVALSMVKQGVGLALVISDEADTTLQTTSPHGLDFGAVRFDVICRDKRPSRAARALQRSLLD